MGSSASKKLLASKYDEVISRAAGSHEFCFISADKLREFPTEDDSLLPCHQDLLKQEGWLIKEHIAFYTLVKGGYDDKAMISHRWVTPKHPDPKKEQLVKIKEFLRDHPHIRMVWFDFGSLPQGKRDPEQERYFRETLNHISILYLSLPVLIIYDKQYGSRFWCNLEMYLSLRKASVKGIGPANEDLDSRFKFYCIGSAKYSVAEHKAAALKDWKDRTVSEAAALLSEDDIMVTNKRDKEEQLRNLTGLVLRIQRILIDNEAELEEMSRRRLEELKSAKPTAVRLPELEREVTELEKRLEEAKLEMAEAKKAMARAGVSSGQELEEEVMALETFLPPRMNVCSTAQAFFAELQSGKCIAWGHRSQGGDLTAVQATLDADSVDGVWSTGYAFFVRLKSGKCVAWGHKDCGGDLTAVQAILDTDSVDQVWSLYWGAFLAKLTSGKCVAWGKPKYGGDLTEVQAVLDADSVYQVWSTGYAFLAKLTSGKCVAWGNQDYGGDLTSVQAMLDANSVDQVWSTGYAFLAKLISGKCVSWGGKERGGDLTSVQTMLDADRVDQVWSTDSAFFAKLTSGKCVAWGRPDHGGDLTGIQAILHTDSVDKVWCTQDAFFAKLTSGKCVAWGAKDRGGDLTSVQAIIDANIVDQVWSTRYGAFFAKLTSGKCVAWGHKDYGGDITAVETMLSTDGVDQVRSTSYAFFAKLRSGKYVSWGLKDYGADLTAVQAMLDADGVK